MGRGLFEGWHLIILVGLLVVLFGFRRLPDAARSIGRSMRIFKSEVNEMKTDGKSGPKRDSRDWATPPSRAHADADPTVREDDGPNADRTRPAPPAPL